MRTLLVLIVVILVALFVMNYAGSRASKNATIAVKEASKEAAEKAAKQAEEVREKLKEEKVGERLKKGSEEAVSAIKKGAAQMEKLTLDASITAAVKMKLANDEKIEARDVDVDTKNGVVTLKGKVSSREEAERAVQLAREVSGVTSVNSELTYR